MQLETHLSHANVAFIVGSGSPLFDEIDKTLIQETSRSREPRCVIMFLSLK